MAIPPKKYKQIQIALCEIKKGNSDALKTIFDLFAQRLFYHALKLVGSKESAEEIVQDVIISIWENRKDLNIQTSLEPYLYSSVKNRSISYLRKQLSKPETSDLSQAENSLNNSTIETPIEYDELVKEVQRAIDALPDRCRLIFNLSRNSEMTYKQIATELNISPESVKTQIGIALKKLKTHIGKS